MELVFLAPFEYMAPYRRGGVSNPWKVREVVHGFGATLRQPEAGLVVKVRVPRVLSEYTTLELGGGMRRDLKANVGT